MAVTRESRRRARAALMARVAAVNMAAATPDFHSRMNALVKARGQLRTTERQVSKMVASVLSAIHPDG